MEVYGGDEIWQNVWEKNILSIKMKMLKCGMSDMMVMMKKKERNKSEDKTADKTQWMLGLSFRDDYEMFLPQYAIHPTSGTAEQM